jgi:hypothetical protein
MAKHKEDKEEETEQPERKEFPIVNPAETESSLKRPATVARTDARGYPAGEFDTTPSDLADYKGEFMLAGHKEPFGLKLVMDDPYGRTHHAKNKDYSWTGTPEQFKKEFEKK